MLKNFLKIALRNLAKNRTYSVINISGLALSITACLLITFYVIDELTFDTYHPESDRLFRVAFQDFGAEQEPIYVSTPEALQVVLKKDSPLFEKVVRFTGGKDAVVELNDNLRFFEPKSHFQIDPEFFETFSVPLVSGNAAFTFPEAVLLSESTAQKYFGSKNPLGKTIIFNNTPRTIIGIFKEIPHNSHLPKFKIITRLESAELNDWTWGMLAAKTYVRLKKSVSPETAAQQITKIVHRYRGDTFEKDGKRPEYFLQPIEDIHLHSHFLWETGNPGNARQVVVFSIIAFLILAIAALNFVNLTTARFATRTREVGIRKISGASRPQLIRQFLGEACVICLIAFLIALFFLELSLPWFNALTGKHLSLRYLTAPRFLLAFFVISGVMSLLAGAYPAFFLAGFQPAPILKGNLLTINDSARLRKILLAFQFTVSITLIISTLVIYLQIHFMKSKDLGFHQEQMLVIPTQTAEMAKTLKTEYATLKTELLRHHSIHAATAQLNPPGRIERESPVTVIDENGEREFVVTWQFIDSDYLATYQIPLVASRSTTGKVTVVLNETAVKAFGWPNPEAALGNRVKMWIFDGEIVGVVQDFHYGSLHHAIQPLVLMTTPQMYPESITLRLHNQNVTETVAFVNATWKKFFPNHPFEYFFIKSDFARLYRQDEQFARIVLLFAGLAIFIAVLGLFGLTALEAGKRTKEIGIRKVLGATVSGIVGLISREFVLIVVLAAFIAGPIGYFTMNRWLQNFAYRTQISWWIFLLSGLTVLVIVFLTVSYQALRAATANPVESLRYE